MEVSYMIPTLFGLEGVAAQECKRLGLWDVKGENGRVICRGNREDLARLNLNLRTGERVVVLLGRFWATNFDALYRGTFRLPWEAFIPETGRFPVGGHCVDSRLESLPACQAVIQKAVATRLGQAFGLTRLPETGATYQIRFTLLRDEVLIGLDTTGPGLHKRGYRALGVEAPLRETLAAGLVLLSRYHGQVPFRDPFCGSGTLPIEAALIARNRAPGLGRSFAAQSWATIPQSDWTAAVQEARDREYARSYDIWGGDLDPAAVDLARHNAQLAGVADTVRFEPADALAFRPQTQQGMVVTNPPYGERLLDKQTAEDLYRAFGKVCRGLGGGWTVSVLSSHSEFERTFGLGRAKRRKLYNGTLQCNLYQYSGGKE